MGNDIVSDEKLNCAHRLHAFLARAQEQSPSTPIFKAWANVFGIEVESADNPEILNAVFTEIVRLGGLADEVERLVKLRLPEPSPYLRHFPTVRKVIFWHSMRDNWQSVKPMLANDVVQSVEFCAARLSEDSQDEKSLPAPVLSELRKEVESLLTKVQEERLPTELGVVLIDALELARRAIDEYSYRGIAGLREMFFQGVGGLTVYYSQSSAPGTAPIQRSEVEQQFWGFLQKVHRLVRESTPYITMLQLPSTLQALIE